MRSKLGSVAVLLLLLLAGGVCGAGADDEHEAALGEAGVGVFCEAAAGRFIAAVVEAPDAICNNRSRSSNGFVTLPSARASATDFMRLTASSCDGNLSTRTWRI